MPPIRLGPDDFLEYNAHYGVLICRECQYAIQKSALQSHLLRHKIYREQRQRLLSSIAQLRLFEPEEVPVPEYVAPAIEALPVISGYRCTADNCGNLCASYKRMRRHRSEAHGLNEDEDFSEIARPAKLQTFFRGTKIRYFEVTPLPVGTTILTQLPHADNNGSITGVDLDGVHDDEELDVQMLDEGLSMPSRVSTPLEADSNAPTENIDLGILTYFHHYTTVTSLTLPCVDPAQSAADYWQTEVVLIALRERWLMCGLLALSAVHLAALAHDPEAARGHRERLNHLFPSFAKGWEEATEVDHKVMMAGEHIRRVLRCTQDLIVSQLVIRSGGAPDDDVYAQEETFSFASRMLKAASSPGTSLASDTTLSAVLDRLGALPARMTKAFGRPDNTGDVIVILTAIAALIECYSASFASLDAGLAWRGMESWLDKVPHRFHHMVSQSSLAALVVLAHWAATLVRRSEQCGCWFLRGSPEAILLYVEEQLPSNDLAIQSLIEGLR